MFVLGVLAFAAHGFHRVHPTLKIASVRVRVSPKPIADESDAGTVEHRISGDASWALSALPECFTQRAVVEGSIAFVRSKLPRDMQPIAPGTTVVSGSCSLFIRRDDAVVTRGYGDRADMLRIPSRAHFFMRKGEIVLFRSAGSAAEMRRYVPVRKPWFSKAQPPSE